MHLAEGLDEIMHALLGDDPAEKQEIPVFAQTERRVDPIGGHDRLGRDAVGDEPGVTPIGIPEVLLHVPAEHDHLIRAGGRGAFAEFQIRGGEFAPLGAPPIQTVNGGDRADPGPMGQTEHHAGTFGMVVDHVGPLHDGTQRGEEGRRQRGEPLAFDGGNGNDVHPMIGEPLAMPIGHAVEFGSGDVMPATVVRNDLMPAGRHPRSQLIDHDLDAALPGGDALMPDECNPHTQNNLTSKSDSA